ncbi:MAG: cellulase family glycosylhydrolase, partial [Actinomycetota bacterium]|nr:cellulase family glycosylhydrolase [Actinomycetota bacterium]
MALLAAVCVVALVAAGESARASTPSVGVQFHGTWSDYSDEDRLAVLDKLAAAGVDWVRIDLGWRTFQENDKAEVSEWYADRADRAVDAARERGLKVLATLLDTPSWANGGRAKQVPPSDPADYSRFARCAAAHFRGRVAAWEVWNEPNFESFWDGADPARYAALLRAAHPAIKAGDPEALVVAGAV